MSVIVRKDCKLGGVSSVTGWSTVLLFVGEVTWNSSQVLVLIYKYTDS